MRDLERVHEEHVFFAWIPRSNCGAECRCGCFFSGCLFLGVESQSMRRAEAQEFWSSRVSEFCVIAEYVAKRLAAYYWPLDLELRSQYRDLVMHWGGYAHVQIRKKACPGPASAQSGKDL